MSTLIQSSPKNRIKSIQDLANSKLDVGFDDVIHTKVFLNVRNSFCCTDYSSIQIMGCILFFAVYEKDRDFIFAGEEVKQIGRRCGIKDFFSRYTWRIRACTPWPLCLSL